MIVHKDSRVISPWVLPKRACSPAAVDSVITGSAPPAERTRTLAVIALSALSLGLPALAMSQASPDVQTVPQSIVVDPDPSHPLRRPEERPDSILDDFEDARTSVDNVIGSVSLFHASGTIDDLHWNVKPTVIVRPNSVAGGLGLDSQVAVKADIEGKYTVDDTTITQGIRTEFVARSDDRVVKMQQLTSDPHTRPAVVPAHRSSSSDGSTPGLTVGRLFRNRPSVSPTISCFTLPPSIPWLDPA